MDIGRKPVFSKVVVTVFLKSTNQYIWKCLESTFPLSQDTTAVSIKKLSGRAVDIYWQDNKIFLTYRRSDVGANTDTNNGTKQYSNRYPHGRTNDYSHRYGLSMAKKVSTSLQLYI